MLSFAAAAYDLDKRLLGTFSRNLEILPGAAPDPRTAEFWRKNPDAWAACREDPEDPATAMPAFVEWVAGTAGRAKPVFVAYPAPYDFGFVGYYCHRFARRNPFGHGGAIDMKTLAWARMGGAFSAMSRSSFPPGWKDPMPHTHVALDDALEQGAMFVNMLRDIRGLPPAPPRPR